MIGGLDIQALGRLAASVGFGLAGNATRAITFRIGYQEASYDVASDSQTQSGGQEVAVNVLEYDDRNREAPADVHEKTWMVQNADLPSGIQISQQDTAVDQAGNTWELLDTKLDPSGATTIVTARRR